ncbi:MAG TPA: hypothetical protein VIO83_00375 [Pseudomonas sp.]
MSKLFRNTLYLQLQSDKLRALHVESGRAFAEAPVLAWRSEKGRVIPLAAGNAAQVLRGRPGVTVVNGFQHPRSLLADFSVAERTLQLLFKTFIPATLFQAAPTVILHPLEHLEGGLTQVEIRGLAELLLGAGARRAFIWSGAELSRTALESLQFPAEGGTLHYPEPS